LPGSGLTAFMLIFLLIAVPCHVARADGNAFFEKLDEQRKNVQSFSARFVQKKTIIFFDEQKVSTGSVLYKTPRQMLWKYETPDKTQMRIDSEAVSFYFPELEQIEIYPVEQGDKASPLFFAFEATADEIKRTFEIAVVFADAGLCRVELFPKAETMAASLKSVVLWLDESDYLPRRIMVREISGDKTEIELTDVRINEPVADKDLTFNAPEGTPIIRPQPGAF
jgi:outer membrane lipoprotein-sorting protein